MQKKYTLTGLLCLLACVFFSFQTQAQAPNDICAAAFPISSGLTVSGTTTGANVDAGLTSCGTSITAPGVWYFIIGNGGLLTASTCNQAAYDTKLTIFEGNCGALTCLAGNDDASGCSGFTSEVSTVTQPGQFYYILVHGFGSNTGNFDLTATLGAPPTGNDACGGALPIGCGQTVTGTTVGATPDNASFCGTSNSAPGVWYQLVGNGDLVSASLCNGTAYDSKLSVYSGSCGALTCVGGNDDFCGLQSQVDFQTVNGQTYYILVHGFGSATGAYTLDLSCIPAPTNDSPCNAAALSIGANAHNHFGLSADPGEVGPGAGTGTSSCNSQDGWCSFELDVDNSAWFTFVAPASGSVSIVADGPGFDSQLAVYSVDDCADYSTYTLLAANDDSGDDIIPAAGIFTAGIDELSCLTPGETYYVQLDGYNGDETIGGTVTLIDNGGSIPVVDAGACQSRFLGYAPAEADTNFLKACVTGGVAPFIFTWTGGSSFFQIDGATCSDLAVQPGATTTYTVTVTDARGCTSTDEVTVNVIDVTCGNNDNKVQVCHYPPGNPNNPQLICISPNAVGAHLDPAYGHSGCHLGPCNNPCLSTNPSVAPPPACVDLTVTVTTDRFANETSWEVVDQTNGQTIGSDSYTFSDDEQTFTTTFCVDPTHCYDVTMFDSFGDGICCTFGTGNWSVTYDGVTTTSPTNGDFNTDETISVGNCGSKTQSAAAPVVENALKVQVYPNPANDMATIKFATSMEANVSIDLFSLTGTKVATVYNGLNLSGQTQLVDINVSELPAGVYVYRVSSAGEVHSGKIQVAH